MTTMQLVEQHVINHRDPRWSVVDAACFLSKNLYNAANYILRQAYIFKHHYITYPEMAGMMRQQPDFCALPRKVSQQVLMQLDRDWRSFFAAYAEWEEHPEKFLGRPKLPKYKHKTEGRNLLIYTKQAVSKRLFKKKGVIQPSRLDIVVETQQKSFDQVRIVPRKTHYVIEVVYTVQAQPTSDTPDRIASVDIGLDNLAAVTFNQPGLRPILVNGRPLKAINQFYNKQRARLQSQLKDEQKTSRRLEILADKRNRRVNAYLHRASRYMIDVLIDRHIGTLVIGKNDGWKQNINLGRRTNQNFVTIPHDRFIQMLTYKAQLAGIQVKITEESYTSKCSFLDLEPIGKHQTYAGKRVHRGLFRAADGRCVNADVNGSYNIMRKVIPNAVQPLAHGNGIAASVVMPVRVTPHERLP